MHTISMTPSKPYLLRALYEWIIDNEMTPYVVIDATNKAVQVPMEFVDDGRIILNISPMACRGLHIENDRVVFTARFTGVAYQIFAPPVAIMAIYAKETGRGMVFAHETSTEIGGDDDNGGDGAPITSGAAAGTNKATPIRKAKPSLKVVK